MVIRDAESSKLPEKHNSLDWWQSKEQLKVYSLYAITKIRGDSTNKHEDGRTVGEGIQLVAKLDGYKIQNYIRYGQNIEWFSQLLCRNWLIRVIL